CPDPPRALHSFPTRRSSDLRFTQSPALDPEVGERRDAQRRPGEEVDRVAGEIEQRAALGAERFGGEAREIVLEEETRNVGPAMRSEEHTSELQSRGHLVCRL